MVNQLSLTDRRNGRYFNLVSKGLLVVAGLVLVYFLLQTAANQPGLFFSQVLNGLQLGFIYALIALGYTLIYGIVKLINFCHGDVVMIGAFTSFYAITQVNLHLWPVAVFPDMYPALGVVLGTVSVIALAMGAASFMSILIDRFAYRPMRERAGSGALIAAVGASMFLEYFAAQPFSYTNNFIIYQRPFKVEVLYANDLPGWAFGGVIAVFITSIILFGIFTLLARRGSQKALAFRRHPIMQFGLLFGGFMSFVLFLMNAGQLFGWQDWDLSVTNLMLIVMVSSILLQVVLQFVVHNTRLGKAMRATSVNKLASRLMGINVNIIITATFGLGGALAGAAGVLYTTAYPRISYLMGMMPGMKAFIAAVIGGVGSIPGAVIGALIMGQAEVLTAGFVSTPLRDAIASLLLIIVLLFRPQGIFGEPPVKKI
jgi:branched-chain amino acid transport system permease protein